MFDIKYIISKEYLDEIVNLTEKEFDENFQDIEGEIQLKFGNNIHGIFYNENECLEGHDWLLEWFERLNEVILNLRVSQYFAITIPDTYDSWFVFRKIDNNTLSVSLEKNMDKRAISPIWQDEPLQWVYKYLWKDVHISVDIFENKVKEVTKDFINQVKNLNPTILNSNSFKKFILKYKL